ncbi:flagellar biosynthesis protein FlhF [Marinimicrobium locisalis]|uniref:flagellar biosynthesis protein FlhF n=1 Tax=Marinimicrobium locisalis TaxID=546022 RepID=UPI003221B5EB
MQVKRFLAADMRRALEMVRQELGPDAVILSSNRTKDGVELLTTRAAPSTPEAPPVQGSTPWSDEPVDETATAAETGRQRADAIERALQRQAAQKNVERDLEASAREYLQPNQRVNAGIRIKRSLLEGAEEQLSGARPMSAAERYPLRDEPSQPVAAPKSRSEVQTAPQASAGEQDDRLDTLQSELAEMRFLLEEQLSKMLGDGHKGQPSRTPAQASVGRRLERMGLPEEVVAPLLERSRPTRDLSQAWSGTLASLARQLPADASDPVAQGGVFALVGPTGAGKTTTIGKLAARYVMEHGPREVALVTLDTHRIGGHDQLRSLARILGVTLRVVDDQQALNSVLYGLRRHSLVLIDTAGFRQGDPRLTEQMASLSAQPQVKSLLMLPSNSQPALLKASLHAYGEAGLEGCILSKLDESASLGESLGVVMQGGVPIVYTTHGQDIPRDIEVARAHQLVTRAASLIGRRDASTTGRGSRSTTGEGAARAVS